MQCVVDRLEEECAVIEYHNKILSLPRVFLPMEICEGDVLDVIILLDYNETNKLKSEISGLMEDVWEKQETV